MTDASDFPQIVRRLVASLAKTQYTPAEELLEKFHGPWGHSVEPAFKEYAY